VCDFRRLEAGGLLIDSKVSAAALRARRVHHCQPLTSETRYHPGRDRPDREGSAPARGPATEIASGCKGELSTTLELDVSEAHVSVSVRTAHADLVPANSSRSSASTMSSRPARSGHGVPLRRRPPSPTRRRPQALKFGVLFADVQSEGDAMCKRVREEVSP
jgi:hypothetical protein